MKLVALKTHKVPRGRGELEFDKYQPEEVDELGRIRKAADITDTSRYPNCDLFYWAQKIATGVIGFATEADGIEFWALYAPIIESQQALKAEQDRRNKVVEENLRRAAVGLHPITQVEYEAQFKEKESGPIPGAVLESAGVTEGRNRRSSHRGQADI